MSRFRNYASALGSSYLALAANVGYTLLSVPLALRYLSNPEFALWGLTLQMAGYIALIDMGMAGASRILIDYKDHKEDPTYGSVIQTTIAVSIVQALLILGCGILLAFALRAALRVPEALHREFVLLVIGQCALLAGTFVTRIFGFLLSAHQRQDVLNYAQTLVFVANLGVLWICLRSGVGVFSILWAQLCGWTIMTVFAVLWCFRLSVFPAEGRWGQPSWTRFSELFAYGRDIFLFVLGNQLINASQVILVTRQLGLSAAAIWVICTRSYLVLIQLVHRIFDSSCPALAEMIVQGDKDRLLRRFRAIVVASGSASVVVASIFALCNQAFVQVWTHGKASWPVVNDVLLAVGFVFSSIARCHIGFGGQTKEFRLLRYISLIEGTWLVSCSFLVLQRWGVPAMLVITIIGTLLFSFPYGSWRTARYFNIEWRQVAVGWPWPSFRLALILVPLVFGIFMMLRLQPALNQLLIGGTVAWLIGTLLLLRCGLDSTLRSELFAKLNVLGRGRNRSTFNTGL